MRLLAALILLTSSVYSWALSSPGVEPRDEVNEADRPMPGRTADGDEVLPPGYPGWGSGGVAAGPNYANPDAYERADAGGAESGDAPFRAQPAPRDFENDDADDAQY